MNNYFRFDTELHSLQEELKKEKGQREKITREKDMAMSDKFSMEQTLSVRFLRDTYNNQINKYFFFNFRVSSWSWSLRNRKSLA